MEALALNCTLKASPERSNTDALAQVVLDALDEEGVETEVVRVVDHDVRPRGFVERRIRDVQILLARPPGPVASNGGGPAVVGTKPAPQPASRAPRVQIDV
jgi:hypothetical protein